MNYISQDIIFNIFSYLSTPYDQQYITPVSKYFHKSYIFSPFMTFKKTLINKAYMIQEDPYYTSCDNLLNTWENIFKFHWPKPKLKYNHTPLWKKNQIIDAKDKISVWGPARIIDTKIDEVCYNPGVLFFERLYHVQFLGWTKSFNEWVIPSKINFFGTKTINPVDPYKYLTNQHKRWCLYRSKIQKHWHYANISVIENFPLENKKKIMITPYQQHFSMFDFITPTNIKNKIKYISDATVLISNVKKFKDDDHRILQY